jgi:Transposase DDE domain
VALDFLRRHFPGLPSYDRFIAFKHFLLMPRLMFFADRSGKSTRSYYMDSIALPVCHNRRHYAAQGFRGLAARGKTSMG